MRGWGHYFPLSRDTRRTLATRRPLTTLPSQPQTHSQQLPGPSTAERALAIPTPTGTSRPTPASSTTQSNTNNSTKQTHPWQPYQATYSNTYSCHKPKTPCHPAKPAGHLPTATTTSGGLTAMGGAHYYPLTPTAGTWGVPMQTLTTAERAAQTIMHATGMSSEEVEDVVARANTKKSGETRRCTDQVLLDIHWPHEKVHRLQGVHTNYGNLSFPEFMAGSLFILSMSLPSVPALSPIVGQLDYLTKLSLEAHDQQWLLVRTAHREVLLSIEHGDLGLTDFQGWQNLKKDTLERLKSAAPANNAIPPLMGTNFSQNNSQNNARNNRNRSQTLKTCRNYNNGDCFSHMDHNQPNSNMRLTHICAYCFTKNGTKSRHPEHICDVKKVESAASPKPLTVPKNEKGGPKQA